MAHYPHTRILPSADKAVDLAGPHIQILDITTGDVLLSTAQLSEEQQSAILKSGPIRCAAVDREFKHLLTSGEDKMLKLWSLDDLKLVNERELPKKPTSVAFTADAQTILVSDKFGDIFRYPFTYILPAVESDEKDKQTEKQNSKDALASHENPSNGQLILGHASPLNAFILTSDEKYIITADRDEHVRVSWYPKGYNIEMYCLGHLKFVSSIHIPSSDPSSLVSGGGDPMLKIWDWMTGTVKYELPVLDAVAPFIAVKASRRRRGLGEEENEATLGGGKKPRGKREKGWKGRKGKEVNQAQDTEIATTPTAGDPDGTDEKSEEDKPEKVLVIHRIDSFHSETGPYVIFSAVGATALFAFQYTKEGSTSDIRHFDFGKPVLDFSVVDNKTVIVNLDGEWVPETSSPILSTDKENETNLGPMAKILKISNGELVEDAETHKLLIDSLNTRSLLPATPESLKQLALYGDLVSLPKYVDPTAADEGVEAAQERATVMPMGAPELSSSEAAKAKSKSRTELSKKELGRIKTKQAVLAKAIEIEAGGEKVRKSADDVEDADAPEAKRARSEVHVGKEDDVNIAEP